MADLPTVSILGIEKDSFEACKALFESLLINSGLVEKGTSWINYSELNEAKPLRTIVFSVQTQKLVKASCILAENCQQFKQLNKDQDVIIGVNCDSIQLLGLSSDDSALLQAEAAKEQVKAVEIQENSLTFRFNSTLKQAQFLNRMLNEIQVEDYTLQGVFLLDLDANYSQEQITKSAMKITEDEESKPINSKRKANSSGQDDLEPAQKKKFKIGESKVVNLTIATIGILILFAYYFLNLPEFASSFLNQSQNEQE